MLPAVFHLKIMSHKAFNIRKVRVIILLAVMVVAVEPIVCYFGFRGIGSVGRAVQPPPHRSLAPGVGAFSLFLWFSRDLFLNPPSRS